MAEYTSNESMLEMYIYETTQNLEQLETLLIACEKANLFTHEAINEIFRIMHTVKGSSSMMLYSNIASLAHAIEDLFFFLREQNTCTYDCSMLCDWVLQGVDFIKVELYKAKNKEYVNGECSVLIDGIRNYLQELKSICPNGPEQKESVMEKHQYYIAPVKDVLPVLTNLFKATLFFEDGCEMENIRAYTVLHNLKEFAEIILFAPDNVLDNDESASVIKEHGFSVILRSDKAYQEMYEFFMQTVFLKDLELFQLENENDISLHGHKPMQEHQDKDTKKSEYIHSESKRKMDNDALAASNQSIISVNVDKLDKLMDLVGEMVITEAMVTQNPDILGLDLESFHKAARQLRKITSEVQDMVMSIRMVPLSITFQRMHRIVRDMCKRLEKDVNLALLGEETEVDKNIIEHVADPLMHLVRNAIDHGIEPISERIAKGKPQIGTVTIEAKNSGSDVLVIVRDDGRGFNKEKILQRAKENGLLTKPENEMTEKEIYSLIFLPGFSTKESVTEYSGRGVGMDVVTKNIEMIGGSVYIDSNEGYGSNITMKIPLTLAIIDGMNIKVGNARYTIPITAIRESFRPDNHDIVSDPDGNEMIMVRGQCYPILRLHDYFAVKTQVTAFSKGILIMVQQDSRIISLFADELLGQQQVVVKTLPNYIRHLRKIRGLAGCTLLGDGSISLILDVGGLLAYY